MAITSKGYPETIAPGADFALMAYGFGRQYATPFVNHCQVTDPGVGTRRVAISTGYLAGKHVVDFNDAVVNIDLPEAATASQWFCIVLNRWVTSNGDFVSQFGYVAGTSARSIPALTQNAGTYDQQPIALVRIEASKTRPQEIIDLRAIAEEPGTYTVYDDLALQTIDRPGITAYNAKTSITYRRVYNEFQAREWQRLTPAGGVHVGPLNQFGQIAIPHTLGKIPKAVSVALGGSQTDPTVSDDVPRDYVATIYSITPTDIIVRITNVRVTTWAGNGLRVAIVWSAQ